MALPNINNGNPLCDNNDLCRHRIVILLEVVNDATPRKKNIFSRALVMVLMTTQTSSISALEICEKKQKKNEKIIQKLLILFLASLNQNVDTNLNQEIKVQG